MCSLYLAKSRKPNSTNLSSYVALPMVCIITVILKNNSHTQKVLTSVHIELICKQTVQFWCKHQVKLYFFVILCSTNMGKKTIKKILSFRLIISLCSYWWKSNSKILIYGYSKCFLQYKQCWYKNIFLCKHIFIPKGNLERPINLTVMFLDHGRKPKYSKGTHTSTGRTYKLHTGRLQAGIWTQDLLATRQQQWVPEKLARFSMRFIIMGQI